MLKNGLSDRGYRVRVRKIGRQFQYNLISIDLTEILSCIVDMKTKINFQKQKNNICR